MMGVNIARSPEKHVELYILLDEFKERNPDAYVVKEGENYANPPSKGKYTNTKFGLYSPEGHLLQVYSMDYHRLIKAQYPYHRTMKYKEHEAVEKDIGRVKLALTNKLYDLPVAEYDHTGKLVRTYANPNRYCVEKEVNEEVLRALICRGSYVPYYGLIMYYWGDEEPLESVKAVRDTRFTPIKVTSPIGVVKQYHSYEHAAVDISVCLTTISNFVNGVPTRLSINGFSVTKEIDPDFGMLPYPEELKLTRRAYYEY